MKKEIERLFLRCGRHDRPMVQDDLISLWPREYYPHMPRLGGATVFVFDIVDQAAAKISGEIALRFGDGSELFYLGHVGYHIDSPYRGKNEALHACRLCVPMFAQMGMGSFTITTDKDNLPSIRTCEKLGCQLECVVPVPEWCRSAFELSIQKNRYIYQLSKP